MVEDEDVWRYHPRYRDRPRGVLTQREREYLFGESDIGQGTPEERSIRQSIRRHIADSILDFSILFSELEERDRRQVFDDEVHALKDKDEELGSVPMGQVRGAATDMIGFLFQEFDNEYVFESKIENGIEQAANNAGHRAKVDVNIDIDIKEPISGITDRLENEGPAALTGGELRTLLDAGEISPVEHAELTLERHEAIQERSGGRLAGDVSLPEEFDEGEE